MQRARGRTGPGVLGAQRGARVARCQPRDRALCGVMGSRGAGPAPGEEAAASLAFGKVVLPEDTAKMKRDQAAHAGCVGARSAGAPLGPRQPGGRQRFGQRRPPGRPAQPPRAPRGGGPRGFDLFLAIEPWLAPVTASRVPSSPRRRPPAAPLAGVRGCTAAGRGPPVQLARGAWAARRPRCA